jgi:hypothetical protein
MYILQGGKLNRLEVFLGTWYIYFLIILLSKYSTVSHNNIIICLIMVECTLHVVPIIKGSLLVPNSEGHVYFCG